MAFPSAPRSIQDIDFAELTKRRYTPSPHAWEDQVLYFLMLDRFSDGREMSGHGDNEGRPVTSGATPVCAEADHGKVDYEAWCAAGHGWQGGTLNGLRSKLGYLSRMGVTAIWISPVFKQVKFQETYHGYAIQNFLDVDPHFGSRDDLRDLVDAAHAQGIYVILDIILNHAGNVFSYNPDRYRTRDPATGQEHYDPRWDGRDYRVLGFNDAHGRPTIPVHGPGHAVHAGAWPDGAVWPIELQNHEAFSRKGRITNWDHSPEYLEGDFFDLKDIHLGTGATVNDFQPSEAMHALCRIFCYWIAYADVDGFRIDTVKHILPGATRFFCAWVREFTQKIGKERFLLVGEVAGDRKHAFTTVEMTGLDAALGLMDIPDRLEQMVKGWRNPIDFFDLFRNSEQLERGPHTWFRNKVVTMVDDHDQVVRGDRKGRFCAAAETCGLAFNALATNLTTIGIPCIYYGSEQGFDSGCRTNASDHVLRENMFGGKFGSFRTQGRHFFHEETGIYQALAQLTSLRLQSLPLRRGRQFLQQISGDGKSFGYPQILRGRMRSVVAWVRFFSNLANLVALNTDTDDARTAYVSLVDRYGGLQVRGGELHRIFWHAPNGAAEPPLQLPVEVQGERQVVRLTVPPAGFVIYAFEE